MGATPSGSGFLSKWWPSLVVAVAVLAVGSLAIQFVRDSSLGSAAGAGGSRNPGPTGSVTQPSVSTPVDAYCPNDGGGSHHAGDLTCPDSGYSVQAGSTSVVLVAANVTYAEAVSVTDSEQNTYWLVANHTAEAPNPATGYPPHLALWVFAAYNPTPFSNGQVTVDVSLSTRMEVVAIDVANTAPISLDTVSLYAAGNASSFEQTVSTSAANDMLLLVAATNGTCVATASWASSTQGTILPTSSGNDYTYRDIVVGSYVAPTAGSVTLGFQWTPPPPPTQGKTIGGCGYDGDAGPSPAPFVSFLVAFLDTSGGSPPTNEPITFSETGLQSGVAWNTSVTGVGTITQAAASFQAELPPRTAAYQYQVSSNCSHASPSGGDGSVTLPTGSGASASTVTLTAVPDCAALLGGFGYNVQLTAPDFILNFTVPDGAAYVVYAWAITNDSAPGSLPVLPSSLTIRTTGSLDAGETGIAVGSPAPGMYGANLSSSQFVNTISVAAYAIFYPQSGYAPVAESVSQYTSLAMPSGGYDYIGVETTGGLAPITSHSLTIEDIRALVDNQSGYTGLIGRQSSDEFSFTAPGAAGQAISGFALVAG